MPSMKSVENSPKDGLSVTGSYVSDVDDKDDFSAKRNDNKKQQNGKSQTNSSSESDVSRSNESNKVESGKTSEGRVVQVARISESADGWSVVDLRNRLETEVKGETNDQPSQNEITESDDSEINKTDDETEKRDPDFANNEKEAQNGKKDNKIKENGSEIEKEEESESYDEWSECQESCDPSGLTALKSASGVSIESTDSNFSKVATNAFQPSLVQSCVHYFQAFFSEFVNQRIITTQNTPSTEKNVNGNRRNSAVILEELLSTPGEEKETDSSNEKRDGCDVISSEKGLDERLPWEHESSLLCAEAFAAACRLLVELSCFPVYCSNDYSYHDPNQLDGKCALNGLPVDSKDVTHMSNRLRYWYSSARKMIKSFFTGQTSRRLPEWLQALIVCCFRVEDFNVQSFAVGTLLDLVNLTLSVAPNTDSERPKSTVVVVVIPMISHANLNIIEESCIYRVNIAYFFLSMWEISR